VPEPSANGSSPGGAARLEVGAATGALRQSALAAVGVVGRAERTDLGAVLDAQGTGWYPLLALSALVFADASGTTAIMLVRPAVQRSIGAGALGSLSIFGPVFFAVAAWAGLLALRRRPDTRMAAARGAAGIAGVAVLAGALATSSVAILGAALLLAAASGISAVLLAPMLFDAHRPEVRVRVATGFGIATMTGIAVAGLITTIGGGVGLTWRAELLGLALVPWAAALLTVPVPSPAVGRFDRDRITRLVRQQFGDGGGAASELNAEEVDLTVMEQFRRVTAPGAAPTALAMAGAFGMFARTLPGFLDVFLRDRWGLAAPSRALAYALLCLVTVPGLVWFGRRAEIAFRLGPRHLVHLTASVASITAVSLGAAPVLPAFALSVGALAVAFTGFAVILVTAVALLLTLCEPAQRGYAAALLGGSVLVGGIVGQVSLATIGSRFGVAGALETAAVLGLAVAGMLVRALPSADTDLGAVAARMVETDELAARVAHGHHLPLLSCRSVDFSYGQVQVLFGVSFTIDDGEMVALLGTNGAGKSTLLRLISGLSFPSSGSVHYRGRDVTFLDTDRRVQLGIAQIPGGRAVFGAMSVEDNLRAFGHTMGRDRRRMEDGIEKSFAAFPQLAERRDQLASTLSGGEQQMLGLGKALILQPRLLLIDELSLGLAPLIVGQLLDMVRRINQEGTAVVLVEQSVNVALSVVDHAYFMEKGEMRFDGAADELLARPDLLRSVFLQGATKGIDVAAAP
jgi:ABC-type branched-subunit amino acid transport system ATPase component